MLNSSKKVNPIGWVSDHLLLGLCYPGCDTMLANNVDRFHSDRLSWEVSRPIKLQTLRLRTEYWKSTTSQRITKAFQTGSARLRLKGEPVRMAIPISTPKNWNIFRFCAELALGFKMKQSLLVPASSRPFGVRINSGKLPFCSSSHISAILSLYPPPQSSTLSPWFKKQRICFIFN